MWAKIKNKEYTECINCGFDDIKHMARGLCTSCYFCEYNKKPKRIEDNKRNKRAFYLKNREMILKKARSKRLKTL